MTGEFEPGPRSDDARDVHAAAPTIAAFVPLFALACERGPERMPRTSNPGASSTPATGAAAPVEAGAIAVRREVIALPGFFAEGIAWDPARAEVLLGGIVDQSIAAVPIGDAGGEPRRFAAPDPAWSVFGVDIDAERGLVWAACAAVSQGRALPAELGRAGLFAFTLGGAPVKAILTEPDAATHLFGDLEIAADGTVFVTDTTGGGVFAAAPDAKALRVVVSPGSYRSIQGLALFDAATLVVADYSAGLVRLGLDASGVAESAVVIERPTAVDLRGIDGIALRGRELAAVQNGASPPQVLRLTLSEDARKVVGAEVLVVPDPEDGEPTLATFVGDELWVTQTDRWDRVFDPKGRPRADVEIAAPVILRIPW